MLTARLWAGAAVVSSLERYAPRGVLMIPVCLLALNFWRTQPMPFGAAVNVAGVMLIILALAAVRMAPREVVSVACLALLAGLASVAAGDFTTARVFLGGLFLVAAWTATAHSESPFDWALSAGLWTEFIAWALGNASRGTFGSDVAVSAIGQAYGAWAQPAQWLAIFIAYVAATWRWQRG